MEDFSYMRSDIEDKPKSTIFPTLEKRSDIIEDKPELLPCPFCGSRPNYYSWEDKYRGEQHEYDCNNGECPNGYPQDTEEDAVKAWNTRYQLPFPLEVNKDGDLINFEPRNRQLEEENTRLRQALSQED